MPKLLERLSSQLQAKGMPKRKAYAVATKKLQESGSLKKGTQDLTPKGKVRQEMGAAGRAKDRVSKTSGRSANDYTYSSKTNRATLKEGR